MEPSTIFRQVSLGAMTLFSNQSFNFKVIPLWPADVDQVLGDESVRLATVYPDHAAQTDERVALIEHVPVVLQAGIVFG